MEQIDDAAPRGVGERGERAVEIGGCAHVFFGSRMRWANHQ